MGRATVTTLALGLEPEWVTDKLKPPVGDLSQNGLSQNGLSQNGLSQNGLSQNGLSQNGLSQNG